MELNASLNKNIIPPHTCIKDLFALAVSDTSHCRIDVHKEYFQLPYSKFVVNELSLDILDRSDSNSSAAFVSNNHSEDLHTLEAKSPTLSHDAKGFHAEGEFSNNRQSPSNDSSPSSSHESKEPSPKPSKTPVTKTNQQKKPKREQEEKQQRRFGEQKQDSGEQQPRKHKIKDRSYSFGDLDRRESAFLEPLSRTAFIRKVYSILLIQLTVCFSFVALCTFEQDVKKWMTRNYWIVIIFALMYIGCLLVMCVSPHSLMRPSMASIAILIILTVSLSGLTGYGASRYTEEEVLIAIGATMAVVLLLTLLACQTTYDFTSYMGIMCVIFIIFIIVSIVAIFLYEKIPILRLIISGIGAMIFCIFLVIDTQLLMSGKRYSLDTDMYIFGAINLFLDIVLLFRYILRLTHLW